MAGRGAPSGACLWRALTSGQRGAAASCSARVRPSRGRARLCVRGDIPFPGASVWAFEEDIGGKILTCGHTALSSERSLHSAQRSPEVTSSYEDTSGRGRCYSSGLMHLCFLSAEVFFFFLSDDAWPAPKGKKSLVSINRSIDLASAFLPERLGLGVLCPHP